MKTALGMIIRSLESDTAIMSFIDNALMFGHKLDCVIVAYTHHLDPNAVKSINSKLPLFAVNINDPHYNKEQMRRRGVSDSIMKELLECPVDTTRGLVPYGFNRMIVVIEAILRDVDILFFVDSDVVPSVLRRTAEGLIVEEVDYFKAHLDYLNSGSDVTTGEYSGYNILPPASFNGMDDLLAGVQKEGMLEYWQTSEIHRSLVVQSDIITPEPCSKILGGNTAIKLSAFAKLPPFFSSYYFLNDEMFLCRGEDTILGIEISQSGIICTDVGINPLHDTYKDYPAEPDLRGDPSAQTRFYYACTGWVGRNPLFNYILGNDLPSTKEYQRERLGRGLLALTEYTSNPRFRNVIDNFDASWDNLGRYITEFEKYSEAWEGFKERIGMNK